MRSDFDETRRQLLAGSVGLATSLYAAQGLAATTGGNPTPVDEGKTMIRLRVTYARAVVQ